MIESSQTTPKPGAGSSRTAGHDPKWGPILVGSDGSEGAGRAVDSAGALAAQLGTPLWIAHVIDASSDETATQFARSEDTCAGDVTEAMAQRVLMEAAERAEAAGAKRPHTTLRWGSSAEEIIAAAREADAKAIFVGRRGAGGRLAQALTGSVSQKLSGISPVMLVIVP